MFGEMVEGALIRLVKVAHLWTDDQPILAGLINLRVTYYHRWRGDKCNVVVKWSRGALLVLSRVAFPARFAA